jgi:serine/threonine protein phosphatase PrpC
VESVGDKEAEDEDLVEYANALVIAEPEIKTATLTDDDDFLLLACDGLFDVFDSQEAVDVIRREMIEHQDAQKAAEALAQQAIQERGSRDNVTVVIAVFRRWW